MLVQSISLEFELLCFACDDAWRKFLACGLTDPHGIVLLGVAFESVTVRSREVWSVYIRGLTHATSTVRTQVKSTVQEKAT